MSIEVLSLVYLLGAAAFIVGLKPSKSFDETEIAASQRRVVSGKVVIRGPESPLLIETELEPEVLWLDRRQEVFGRFFCETCWPRQTMLKAILLIQSSAWARSIPSPLETESISQTWDSPSTLPMYVPSRPLSMASL